MLGVIFIWGIGPILDVALGESKNPRPPRESGTPFEALLWVHGLLHFVMLGTFFVFAASEGMTRWLVAASLSTGLVAAKHQPSSPHMNSATRNQRVRVGGWQEPFYSA